MKKQFVVDRLVDENNICNLEQERDELLAYIQKKEKVVVYGPRNYGKTSLLKNVIIKRFKSMHKKSFVFFADLMEVSSMDRLVKRLANEFEKSYSDSFPIKQFIDNIQGLFSAIRTTEVTIDPVTGKSQLSLSFARFAKNYNIQTIFDLISEVAKKTPTLVVLDEFQDIAKIPEAQALFRQALQSISTLPIITLGSKKQLLSSIFANPEAPLAFWGHDVVFEPIDYDIYHRYIQERFATSKLKLSSSIAKDCQDLLFRVPESINMVCQYICQTHQNTQVTLDMVKSAIRSVLDSKRKRYESFIAQFSEAEERVIVELARQESVTHPQSKTFTANVGLTSRSVGKIFKKLLDKGIFDQEDEAYYLADPMLYHYVRVYR